MDMYQASKYFDLQDFENYNFLTKTWENVFKAQLKVSDKFQTIYHRPTRKRTLYCAPENSPTSSVIRDATNGEIFMVGSVQNDLHANVFYRRVFALHKPSGTATVHRKIPAGPSDNPGFGVNTLVEETFSDIEIRSVNENQESLITHRAHFLLYLPSDSLVARNDLVTLNGLPYYILEAYDDSGYHTCRAAQQDDPREDFVFKKYTGQTYVGGVVTPAYTSYNVTGKVHAVGTSENFDDLANRSLKILIQTDFIGVAPLLDDLVTYAGRDYEVKRVLRDSIEDHWELLVTY